MVMVADFHVRHLALGGEANDQGAKLLRIESKLTAVQCIFMQL